MRILFSFFLSLIVYFLILLFLYFSFFKKDKTQEVLIHTAIVKPETKSIKIHKNKLKKQKVLTKQTTKKPSKIGSKKNITKSGDVKLEDIFKNVDYNVSTKKVSLKKEEVLSRFKANNIVKKLNNVKNIKVNISFSTSSNVKKEKVDELVKKISSIWDGISDIAGEYATIKFINENGKVFVYILETNLDSDKQKILLNGLKNIQFDKNIELKIKLQTKVDE